MTQLELDFGEEFARPPKQTDEIIEIAKEAGFKRDTAEYHKDELEAFAKLVQQKMLEDLSRGYT
jgi:hypothetical protein